MNLQSSKKKKLQGLYKKARNGLPDNFTEIC